VSHLRIISERCEPVKSIQMKVTISEPVEFPERKLPYVVRWRLNGKGHWRSFATRRGVDGADAFHALLKVAAMNERDWSSVSGLPSSLQPSSDMNVAHYCRSYIQDEWRRLSPSTRRSYVEALASFVSNCTLRGAANSKLTIWQFRENQSFGLSPTVESGSTHAK